MAAIGEMRHRVRVERRSSGVDALGEPEDVWIEVVTVWAAIEDRRGREILEANQVVVNQVTTLVRTRYREDVAPEMRVQELCHAERLLDIRNVRYGAPTRPELLLECEEVRVTAEAVS